MIEDRFEQDLRAVVVRGLAPDEVPAALRDRLATVTAELPGHRHWLLARLSAAAAVVAAIAVVAAVGFVALPRGATNADHAASAVVGSFLVQTDGKYGYKMLRPAGWTAIDAPFHARGFSDAAAAADARVILSVGNLAVAANSPVEQPGTTVPMWEAFRQDSSLDGWTAGVERFWRSIQVSYTRLDTLPNAKVYAVRPSDGSTLSLVAYVIDGGQPLFVTLDGSPAHPLIEPLEQLRTEGLYPDFITIVKSLRAIPADPANVSPSLP